MTPIRVLVVDDSAVVRRLVSSALGEDPEIEVVGTASDGRQGVERVMQFQPDVVTLDIEMPVMNGIEALREIRRLMPRLPVIMFSTLTEAGASATLDALAAGASDFVTKPANVGNVAKSQEAIREQLVPRIRELTGRLVAPTAPASPPVTTASTTDTPAAAATRMTPFALRATSRVSAIAIAVSTGGPNALSAIWPQLADLRVPVFVVQHMPPVFTASLAAQLTSYGTVPVDEGSAGAEVVAGHGYLAPGDHHMTVERSRTGVRLRLDQGPHINGCRPAADPLFESVAAHYGAGTLGLVLTGRGSDGTAGARAIRNAGGHLLAQDQESCVVWGMPRAVTEAGLVDEVVPLRRIAATLNAVASRARGRQGVAVP